MTITATYTAKYLIDLLAGEWVVADATKELLFLFSLLLGIALLRVGTQKAKQYCQVINDELINEKVALMMMEHSLTTDLEYFDDPDYYEKLMSSNRDSAATTTILWNSLAWISACISFCVAIFALAQTNLLYGLFLVAAAVPSSIVSAKYTKMRYALSLDQLNELRKMGYCQNIATNRSYAQEVRLFNASERIISRYKRIWNEYFDKRKNPIKKQSILTAILDCLPELVVIVFGLNVALNIIKGNGTVGQYSLYIGLAGQLLSAIMLLSYSVMQIYDNQLKLKNLKGLSRFVNHIEDTGKLHLGEICSIEFDHVSFTYPRAEEPVLHCVSFKISKGTKIAIVGLNGSGKSTLIKLLLRMYNLDSGRILINDVDIREYQLAELRANFSVYFQDMLNYSFSLRENFTIADDLHENEDDSIMIALNMAYCNDVLEKAIGGFETGITRLFDGKGIELSGGQHQKLALARTFYRRHTALVLDEPSSNLDPEAEHEIFHALKTFTENKLTIFTSHRLSNISLADRIIVMEKGRVIEEGTPKELLANESRYAQLFRYQQEKYTRMT